VTVQNRIFFTYLFSQPDWCQQVWLTAGEFCKSFTAVYCITLPDSISAKFPKIL